MKEPKVPVRWDEFTDILVIDDGEEWDAVTEAFNRHYPDRAGRPFDPANYSQAEIDAVMVEFEPKKKSGNTTIVLGENEVFMRLEGGEEWCAVTEAFNRHYPDRAGLPFDPANYSQAEIDAVMVEFEPKQKPAKASSPPAHVD